MKKIKNLSQLRLRGMGRLTCAAAALALSGCATQPDNLSASYVPVGAYAKHDCNQLILDANNINRRLTSLYASLKKKADNDTWQMGVGLILFWPTLFALEGGDGPEAADYSRLKGEYEAIQQAAVQKSCDLDAVPEFKSPEDYKQEQVAPAPQAPAPKEKSRVIVCAEGQTCIVE